MFISGGFPNVIRFEGTQGWIFVSCGNESVTNSDPMAKLQDPQALAASDPRIITSVIGPDEIHLPVSQEHHGNWLQSVRSRQKPIAPSRGRTSGVLDLFAASHRHEVEAQTVLGSSQGALQKRRSGQCNVVAPATGALHYRSIGVWFAGTVPLQSTV